MRIGTHCHAWPETISVTMPQLWQYGHGGFQASCVAVLAMGLDNDMLVFRTASSHGVRCIMCCVRVCAVVKGA